jgi:hypothetical protein
LVSALVPGSPKYPGTGRTTKTDPATTGRRGEGVFEGRAAVGYDHGYNAEEVFYLGLALDEKYVEGFVEGCLERIGEDDPNEEEFSRGVWEDGDDRGFVLEAIKGGVEVRAGRT